MRPDESVLKNLSQYTVHFGQLLWHSEVCVDLLFSSLWPAGEWISGAACMYITNHLVTEYAANNSLVGHLK